MDVFIYMIPAIACLVVVVGLMIAKGLGDEE